jgi:hypothetical protein
VRQREKSGERYGAPTQIAEPIRAAVDPRQCGIDLGDHVSRSDAGCGRSLTLDDAVGAVLATELGGGPPRQLRHPEVFRSLREQRAPEIGELGNVEPRTCGSELDDGRHDFSSWCGCQLYVVDGRLHSAA